MGREFTMRRRYLNTFAMSMDPVNSHFFSRRSCLHFRSICFSVNNSSTYLTYLYSSTWGRCHIIENISQYLIIFWVSYSLFCLTHSPMRFNTSCRLYTSSYSFSRRIFTTPVSKQSFFCVRGYCRWRCM